VFLKCTKHLLLMLNLCFHMFDRVRNQINWSKLCSRLQDHIYWCLPVLDCLSGQSYVDLFYV
jgi:hypothetical protein